MGQPARPIDSGYDSSILPWSPRAYEPEDEREDAEDDDPTRPYDRVLFAVPARDPIADLDRATGCAVARLGALVEWIDEDDPSGDVVPFVRSFLAEIGTLNEVMTSFGAAARGSSSQLRSAADALSGAAALWRANLVDYVDELALIERNSLQGWSSLPTYSAMYTLAFVMPALAAVRAWVFGERAEPEVDERLCKVEESIAELIWILGSVAGGE